MNGFLYIDKPAGWTSRDVCNKIQHLLHVDKVGHCGTLDPFATGLLILCINKASKTISYIEDSTKEYIATLHLGIKTDTGDHTGNIIEKSSFPNLTKEKITSVLNSFMGENEQLTPLTSARHVNGKRLYNYYYNNEQVERPIRKVVIHSIELIDYSLDTITFKTIVSKGTYIRTLGEDIANKLGTIGHLSSLRRTKIGQIDVNKSLQIENVSSSSLVDMYDVLSLYLYVVPLDGVALFKAQHGALIEFLKVDKKEDIVLITDYFRNCIAIYKRDNGDVFKCIRGLL